DSPFLSWCKKMGLELNSKVHISMHGTVSQYGMLAHEDISTGELLFKIPRSALLSQHTTRICDLLEKAQESLQSRSGWVPLLISLLYEATDVSSSWHPYFALWPDLTPPDLPMFWSEAEQTQLLKGTGVPEAVRRDMENMEKEYNSIVLPFIKKHPDTFCPEKHAFDLYKRLVAFVMAYSFQEPMEEEEEDTGKEVFPPMMVPVADLLNHIAQHNARLEFTPECLRMISISPIHAGQEVFNTYGQMANWQLLHMYGFTEPHPQNCNETADIRMVTLKEAALQGAVSEERVLVQEKWDFLCNMEMVSEEGALVFGCSEVMTDEEVKTCLKVLCMSAEEFAEYKDNEGWEEDEDEEEETMTIQDIAYLPKSWRKVLHGSAKLTLEDYATDFTTDQELLNDRTAYAKLSPRAHNSLQVRYGQKRILHQVMELSGK
ncbi:LOW QUALITY PROTEIN: N-lysine methyltransferase setd6-like, partial [Bombina bombina]|uniref:LOW QUALITY PROTEIN: N-lysine methyltransferase setd6-like n=1 Tax=Bombina bombina TaxID=8345 RepID=UPI00235AD826